MKKIIFSKMGYMFIPFFVYNLIFYVLMTYVLHAGSNPVDWQIFRTLSGKVVFLLFELLFILVIPIFWEFIKQKQKS